MMATDSTSASRARARPSSSTSEPVSAGLLAGIFARGGAARAVAGDALLQAMLDVEAALAQAWADAGAVPAEAAAAITGACRGESYDPAALAGAAARNVQPVVGLVAALREAAGPAAAEHVHRGATSQDIIDTALMLIARRALEPLLADLTAAAGACAALAERHAETPVVGRTLMQQALPTTFGLKAAGWMSGLDGARGGLERVRDEVLAVQLGGPVGSLDAATIVAGVAGRLELAAPLLPWHTDRRRPAELAAALGIAAGAAAKVAGDVVLLAQSEVAEVREGGPGGTSSSIAHKHNPVAAVSVLACAERVPALVAQMLGAMVQEHERAAGAWQAEWETLPELLRLTGSALAWTAELTAGLEVDTGRMAVNLAAAPVATGNLDAAAALARRAVAAHRRVSRS